MNRTDQGLGTPRKQVRVVLGLDPGSRRTGYGIVRTSVDGITRVSSGAIRLDVARPFAVRLPQLRRETTALIRAHRPNEAALETCFVARSPRAALVLGHVRGVLLLLCLEAGLDVFEYAPSEVKRALTGTGGASKQQVEAMLRQLLLNPPEHPCPDESDALAIAICHISRPVLAQARRLEGLR